MTAASVPKSGDDFDTLGKEISELVDDGIAIEADGSVTGTLKKVTGYTGFSSDAGEQNGHFFPIKLNAPYGTTAVTVTGTKTKTAVEDDWILFVKDKNSTFKFEENGKEIFTLNFKKAAFE